MDNKLKAAFGAVHAEEVLKERTAEFLAQKTGNYGEKKHPISFRLAPVLTCCILLLFLFLGTGWAYFTPVSAISIDINPSLELSINRFDRVLSVTGKNPDGEALAEQLQLAFLPYEDAVRQILDDSGIQELLRQNDPMSIVVVCPNQQRSDTMLAAVKACASGHHNVHCHTGNAEEAAAAQEAGLPLGKYRAFLELQALDPTVTPEDVQDKTMRELRDMIATLSGESSAVSSEPLCPSQPEDNIPSANSHAEEHHGQGNGTGDGSGQRKGHGQGKHRGKNQDP